VSNNWQLYQKLDGFTLREAAVLWLEIPINSEDPQLALIERLINSTRVDIRRQHFEKVVKTEEEAYDLLLTEIAIDHLENVDSTLYAIASGNPSFYSIEDGLHKQIPKLDFSHF
jgi:hypothetical protein